MRSRSRTKYGNRFTVVDGIRFDSCAEADRYRVLRLRERAGEISDLELQPKFVLLPAFERNGTKYRAITYRGDFAYIENGRSIVEDVKGMATDLFKVKEKLFRYHYPDIELRVQFR